MDADSQEVQNMQDIMYIGMSVAFFGLSFVFLDFLDRAVRA